MAVSNRLSVLEMTPGLSNIWVKGLIPYAFGNDSALRLTHDGEYSELDGLESLAELDDVVLGFISLDYGEQLSAAGVDERSILIVGGGDLNSSDQAITAGLHYFGTDSGVKVFGNDRWGMIFSLDASTNPTQFYHLISSSGSAPSSEV